MITSNINAKISSNNNINPKLWINDFMIFNLLFAWTVLIVEIQLYCLHRRSTFKFINIYWVCLKSKTLWICQFSPFSSCSPQLFGRFGGKKYFSDHRAATAILLVVAIKENFSGLFFFWVCRSEGEFPIG